MRRVWRVLRRAADTGAALLLWGEAGTGKRFLARAVHDVAAGAGPLVSIDGGAAGPDALRDAVTAARGGRLLVCDVDRLSPSAQRPLELALAEPAPALRIASTAVRACDVRARLRPDLYYRVATLEVQLPPLCDRGADVGLLAQHFYAACAGADEPPLSRAERSALERGTWPGNVGQLRALMRRAALLDDRSLITAEPGALVTGEAVPRYAVAKRQAVEAFERSYLAQLIARAQGNVSRAARLAGMNRSYLRDLLARHDLLATRDSDRR